MSWTTCAVALAGGLLIGACGSKGGEASADESSSTSSAADSDTDGATGGPSCIEGVDLEVRFYGSDITGVVDGMACMVDAIENAEDETTRLLSIGLTCDAAQGFVTIAVERAFLDAAGLALAIDLAVGDAVTFDRFFAPGTGTERAHDWSSLRRSDGTLVAAGIDGSRLADAPADALATVSPLVVTAADACPSTAAPAPCELWHDGMHVTLDGATHTFDTGQSATLGAFRVIAGRAMRYDLPADGCDPIDGVDVPPAIYQLVAWREP